MTALNAKIVSNIRGSESLCKTQDVFSAFFEASTGGRKCLVAGAERLSNSIARLMAGKTGLIARKTSLTARKASLTARKASLTARKASLISREIELTRHKNGDR